MARVSSRKLYQGGGGSWVIIMKGGHDQIKSRCGFYSKLGYCEGVVEEYGGKLELGGKLPPPVDETLDWQLGRYAIYTPECRNA